MKRMGTLLLVLFVGVVLASVMFAAVEAHHDCSGENCPVCYCLNVCSSLKYLSLPYLAGTVATFSAFSLFTCSQLHGLT